MKDKTVGEVGEIFGLSRSTLLYYDRIGLLSPSSRTEAGYRLYSDQDVEKLKRIVALKNVGITLDRMKPFIEAPEQGITAVLLARIFAINEQIETLKEQQRMVLRILEADASL